MPKFWFKNYYLISKKKNWFKKFGTCKLACPYGSMELFQISREHAGITLLSTREQTSNSFTILKRLSTRLDNPNARIASGCSSKQLLEVIKSQTQVSVKEVFIYFYWQEQFVFKDCVTEMISNQTINNDNSSKDFKLQRIVKILPNQID